MRGLIWEFRFDWNSIVRSFHLEIFTERQRLFGVDSMFPLLKILAGIFTFKFTNICIICDIFHPYVPNESVL